MSKCHLTGGTVPVGQFWTCMEAKFFDLIRFMGVVFNNSSEIPWGSVSMVARINFMKAGLVRLSAALVVI